MANTQPEALVADVTVVDPDVPRTSTEQRAITEVAVGVDAQAELDVITQLTVFPFVRAAFVYVALFVPTLAPFNFHW